MPKLENSVAVVTGASVGIGRATARLLAAEGARVVLNARSEDGLAAVAKEIDGIAVSGDIADPAVRQRVIDACGGRLDVLVNNAGYGHPGPVESVTDEDARRQFDVNLFAAAALMRAAVPLMRARRSGRIVNISSVAGRYGYPLFGWYCASKHALEGLSDAARIELAPWGIQVVLIEPGPVRTKFFDASRAHAEPFLSDENSPYAAYFKHTARIERKFQRMGVTAEKAARVVFKAATAPRPRRRYPITMLAKASFFMLRFLPRGVLDAVIRKQFHVPRPADVQ